MFEECLDEGVGRRCQGVRLQGAVDQRLGSRVDLLGLDRDGFVAEFDAEEMLDQDRPCGTKPDYDNALTLSVRIQAEACPDT